MSQENKIKISKQRDVRTYAEMWHTSRVLLQKGLDEPKGCNHQFMASLVFTAFTFEAYLNQIGKKIFSCWKSIEKLSPKDKLNVIAEKIELEVDYGKRPWQTIKDLFRFRNDIAHGKSEKITEKIAIANNDFADSKINEFSRTKWEKYCTKENAIRAREDVEIMVEELHKVAGITGEHTFIGGMQESTAVLS